MNPKYMGQGIAKKIGMLFLEYVAKNTSLEIIKANVKIGNPCSICFHQSIGFNTISEDTSFVYMENKLTNE
jgi:RimJ/RimL family protein N-acetyltransferase